MELPDYVTIYYLKHSGLVILLLETATSISLSHYKYLLLLR